MRLPSIANETVEILRGTPVTDPYSGEATGTDWSNPTPTVVAGCSVQPITGAEVTYDRDMIVTRWNLWMPSGAGLTASDRVRHTGSVYEVDGSVMNWPGRIPHIQAVLRKVDG